MHPFDKESSSIIYIYIYKPFFSFSRERQFGNRIICIVAKGAILLNDRFLPSLPLPSRGEIKAWNAARTPLSNPAKCTGRDKLISTGVETDRDRF